jgi:hypothetical protein
MPDGEPVINGKYIVVIENGGVMLREEHLAQTILHDVSDSEQDRLPKSGGNPVRVFNRVFPIHVQGTDMSNVTNDLIKSLSKCHPQTKKASNSVGLILNTTITTVKPTKCNIRTVNGAGADEVGAGAYRHWSGMCAVKKQNDITTLYVELINRG